MPVPFEGTQALPSDTNTVPFLGLWDATGSVFYALRSVRSLGDGDAGQYELAVGQWVYNGASWDRQRGDNTGAARSSIYGKGTNPGDTPLEIATAGAHHPAKVTLYGSSGQPLSVDGNGSAYSRLWADDASPIDVLHGTFDSASYTRTVGVSGALYCFNGATFDRVRTLSANADGLGKIVTVPQPAPPSGQSLYLCGMGISLQNVGGDWILYYGSSTANQLRSGYGKDLQGSVVFANPIKVPAASALNLLVENLSNPTYVHLDLWGFTA